jgi:hypothetical protein
MANGSFKKLYIVAEEMIMIFFSWSKLKGARTNLKKVISLKNSSRQAAKLAKNSFKLLCVLASLRDYCSSFPRSAWERCFGAPQCIAHTDDHRSVYRRGPEHPSILRHAQDRTLSELMASFEMSRRVRLSRPSNARFAQDHFGTTWKLTRHPTCFWSGS